MTLRMSGDQVRMIPCPECKGKGKVPCPRVMAVRSHSWVRGERVPVDTPGEGCPMPCPRCLGKKMITERFSSE